MEKVSVDHHDNGVRVLTLRDPQRRNAIGDVMGAELIAAADRVRADDAARALVVTGEGTAFCAGADLPALFGDLDRAVTDTHDRLQEYYRAFFSILELPIPTIAAVNGAAVGAGLNLAMACDIRIAGPDASFGATFSKIGLHPGGGCTWFLVRALGAGRALHTLLLGDPLDAEQAVAWGLAEGPSEDPVAAAVALAARFAAVEPRLARHIKRSVAIAVETGDLGATLEYESWAQAASASSPQLQKWVAKFRS
ncbi:MAG: enoyl-CoA hydratase [Nitriliruptorales bacterium]|nr:enoyl-CoA hydratase [Nitriliruptorales bacterium]